jgi:curved DNA-binding protein CbpA
MFGSSPAQYRTNTRTNHTKKAPRIQNFDWLFDIDVEFIMTARKGKATDLYGVLGVAAAATVGEIKAAYWRAAKTAHPDAGGSAQEFGVVKLAHAVLSDPERRARYDRTGEVVEPEPDNTEQGALGLIGAMLESVLAAEKDPIDCDLVAIMKRHLIAQIAEVSRKLEVTRRSIDRAERMRGRFRRNKPGHNTIERVLDWEIGMLKRSVATSEAALKQRERAIELLGDYDFAQDISRGAFRVRRGAPPAPGSDS